MRVKRNVKARAFGSLSSGEHISCSSASCPWRAVVPQLPASVLSCWSSVCERMNITRDLCIQIEKLNSAAVLKCYQWRGFGKHQILHRSGFEEPTSFFPVLSSKPATSPWASVELALVVGHSQQKPAPLLSPCASERSTGPLSPGAAMPWAASQQIVQLFKTRALLLFCRCLPDTSSSFSGNFRCYLPA